MLRAAADLVKKTLEGIFGHVVKLNYAPSLSNFGVILSPRAAAQPPCIAIIGLFTLRVAVCLTGVQDLKACSVLTVLPYLLNIILGFFL